MALILALFLLAMGLQANAALNSSGEWMSHPTPVHTIPMNMHGDIVYLSAHQKFIYYDAFGYTLGAMCALIVLLGILEWVDRQRRAK